MLIFKTFRYFLGSSRQIYIVHCVNSENEKYDQQNKKNKLPETILKFVYSLDNYLLRERICLSVDRIKEKHVFRNESTVLKIR